jgi:hypothetical protein
MSSDTTRNQTKAGRTTPQDHEGQAQPKLPHEHDESHDSQQEESPRKVIKQAYQDVQSGQEDTDLRANRGERIDSVPKNK